MPGLRTVRANPPATCSMCGHVARYYHSSKTTTIYPGGVRRVRTSIICDNCAIDLHASHDANGDNDAIADAHSIAEASI